MPERLQLGTVNVITDDDTSIYTIGEVDGGFNRDSLHKHIKSHGVAGVLGQLSLMIHEVHLARDAILFDKLTEYPQAAKAAQPGENPCTD